MVVPKGLHKKTKDKIGNKKADTHDNNEDTEKNSPHQTEIERSLPEKRRHTKRTNVRKTSYLEMLEQAEYTSFEEDEPPKKKILKSVTSDKTKVKYQFIDPLEEGLISDDEGEAVFPGFDMGEDEDDMILGFDCSGDLDDQDPITSMLESQEVDAMTVECDPECVPRSRRFACPLAKCSKSFPSQKQLDKHMRWQHEGGKSFMCPICTKRFTTGVCLRKHFKTFHAESDFDEHVCLLKNKKKYGCPICKKRFTTSQYIKKHVETVHAKDDPVPTELVETELGGSENEGEEEEVEPHCDVNKLESRKKYPCPICSKRFTSAPYVKKHVHMVHPEKDDVPADASESEPEETISEAGPEQGETDVRAIELEIRKKFDCPVCSKRFTTSAYVKRHIETIHKEKETASCKEGKALEKIEIVDIKSETTELITVDVNPQEHQIPNTNIYGRKKRFTRNAYVKKHVNTTHKEKETASCKEGNAPEKTETVYIKSETTELVTVDVNPHDHQLPYTNIYDRKKFTCSVCTKRFTSSCYLKIHIKTVHPDKKQNLRSLPKLKDRKVFGCPICPKRFTTCTYMKRHMESIHGETSTEKLEFNSHETNHFIPEILDKTHVDSIHKACEEKECVKSEFEVPGEYFCGECPLSFPSESTLKSHEDEVHKKVLHQCDVCLKYFVKLTNLLSHKRCHTEEGQCYPCAYCNEKFSSRKLLHAHWPTHSEKRMYQCEICKCKFTAPNSLKRHRLLHAGEKLFRCEICQKSFSTLSNLKTHLLIHTGVRRFECKLCGKSFSRRDVLNTHQWVHTGEKNFNCDICLAKFRWRHAVTSHKLIYHSPNKPFDCKICGKKFSHPESFKKHAEVHAEKIFYCQTCFKAFSRPSTLKNHILTHTNFKPFFCDVCQRGFRSKSHLRNHFLVHTKEKPWLCKFCNKTYKDRNQLRRHKRVVHCRAFFNKLVPGLPDDLKTVENLEMISDTNPLTKTEEMSEEEKTLNSDASVALGKGHLITSVDKGENM